MKRHGVSDYALLQKGLAVIKSCTNRSQLLPAAMFYVFILKNISANRYRLFRGAFEKAYAEKKNELDGKPYVAADFKWKWVDPTK